MTDKKTDLTTSSTDTTSEGGPERPDRRDFLSNTAAIGGAMVVGFYFPGPTCAEAAQAPPPVTGPHVPAQLWYRDSLVPEINAWLTIAPDDTVTIRINQTEIGTGVLTSNAMMVTEELQCDWNKVRV